MRTRMLTVALLWMPFLCSLAEEPKGEKPHPPAATPALYENSFEKADEDKVPSEFLVLSGEFKVKKRDENRVLELPGTPLPDDPPGFGLLFGPTEVDGLSVRVRILAAAKGRRPQPVFGVGLNGAGGYLLQVSPKESELQLIRNDDRKEVKAKAPIAWKSGAWIVLRLRVVKTPKGKEDPGSWKVEGKAWLHDAVEPEAWPITYGTQEQPEAGRASIWGNPFSGMPILFDDLTVAAAEEKK